MQYKKNRQGTKPTYPNPTIRHTFVSCGKIEKKILRHLYNHQSERFNIRQFSKLKNIPRPTIYDNLNLLISKGLIKKENNGNRIITKKGVNFFTMSESVGYNEKSSRRGCRKEDLSTHYLKYKLTIKDKSKFSEKRINELNPLNKKENKLRNFTEYYLYFEDATIVIKKNSIIIHIHDIIAKNVDEAHFIAFQKAIVYSNKLRQIGLNTINMTLPQAHYARVESHLSKFLFNIDKRYFLYLEDGNKFWIDYSDKKEDETDSAEYRERLDDFLKNLATTKSKMSDVDNIKDDLDKMKDIFKEQAKLANNFILLEESKLNTFLARKRDKNQKGIPDYFG
ncbi:hypothetical protein LCGC14_1489380 [marine sediment metagenome]|uniref:RuvB winged helix C-terminal domain-containing protein n=1 Tax=marine sediment metagenome TaxID=412755 RepID=A0A0F9JT26_9ZZZZ